MCRFLGRRHDEAIHALWRPASEKPAQSATSKFGTTKQSLATIKFQAPFDWPLVPPKLRDFLFSTH